MLGLGRYHSILYGATPPGAMVPQRGRQASSQKLTETTPIQAQQINNRSYILPIQNDFFFLGLST